MSKPKSHLGTLLLAEAPASPCDQSSRSKWGVLSDKRLDRDPAGGIIDREARFAVLAEMLRTLQRLGEFLKFPSVILKLEDECPALVAMKGKSLGTHAPHVA